MKTQPLEVFLMPASARRWLVCGYFGCLAAAAIMLVGMFFTTQARWAVIFCLALVATGPVTWFLRYQSVRPRLRDPTFLARVRKFKDLRGKPWDTVCEELAADPEVKLLHRGRAVLADPRSWGQGRRYVRVHEGDLLAELFERRSQVGTVRLRWISED